MTYLDENDNPLRVGLVVLDLSRLSAQDLNAHSIKRTDPAPTGALTSKHRGQLSALTSVSTRANFALSMIRLQRAQGESHQALPLREWPLVTLTRKIPRGLRELGADAVELHTSPIPPTWPS